jgi:hypothetical protein
VKLEKRKSGNSGNWKYRKYFSLEKWAYEKGEIQEIGNIEKI